MKLNKIGEFHHHNLSVVAHLYIGKVYYQCGASRFLTKDNIWGFADFHFSTLSGHNIINNNEFITFTNWLKSIERDVLLEQLLDI